MLKLKDTERSQVCMTFDGSVVKRYRGHLARQRMENDIRVLEHLKRVACPFVPRLLSFDREALEIVVSACGVAAAHVSPNKVHQLFDELRAYGVEHEDAELRNITYDARVGHFSIVDFEFASLIDVAERQCDDLDQLCNEGLAS
ncbi:MAG: serine/threonine protein phosphatase [Pirellulaceae bacterium]|nr:serine/threonine protein phosphatase [Pirellulaceae bacterium]